MIEIKGKHNTAIVFTDTLEDTARAQIHTVCDRPEFADSSIRIMPDVHTGLGCTIGTTMTVYDKVVPGMVGVDIGCGMETAELADKRIDFQKMDETIKNRIPSGRNIRKKPHDMNHEIDLGKLRARTALNMTRADKSVGTLGGGNHFIEVGKSEDNRLFLVVHSGSRHIGQEVALHYQKIAQKNHAHTDLPGDLAYLEGSQMEDYLHDMRLIQQYARINRRAMIASITESLGLTPVDSFSTIHNYIDTETMILRKGSVSADAGEKLLIPINMRDGSLICAGKGNDDWNRSAPHGAGRLMSRKSALSSLSLDAYKAQMKGIYTSSISRKTLDEAPMAYKPMDDIVRHIEPTVEILMHIRPVYNFKTSE